MNAIPVRAAESFEACTTSGGEVCQYAKCVADTAFEESLLQEAVEELDLRLATDPEEPCLLFQLGALEFALKGDRTIDLLTRAKDLFAKRGDWEYVAKAGLNLANAFRHRGRFSDAERELEGSSRAAAASGDRNLQMMVFVEEARLLKNQGKDLAKVLHLLRQAVGMVCPDGDFDFCKHALTALGNVASELGRHSEAQSAYNRLKNFAIEAGDLYAEVTGRYNEIESRLEQATEHQEQSVAELEELLNAATTAGHSTVVAWVHYQLGKLSSDHGAGHLERAVEIGRTLERPSMLSLLLQGLAAHLVDSDPDAAYRALNEGLALALETEDPWPLLYGAKDRMHISWATRSAQEAFEDSLKVFEDIETLRGLQDVRGLQDDSSARAGFFSVWTEVYYWLAGRVLESAAPPSPVEHERAFEVVERLRSRTLLDTLEMAGVAPEPSPSVLEEREEVLRQIVVVQRRLLDPDLTPEERAEKLGGLEDAERREAELEERLAREHPDYTALHQPNFTTLAEISANLKTNEALLSFQVARWKDVYGDFAGGSWLLVATRNSIRAIRLPDRAKLEGAVEIVRSWVEQRKKHNVERFFVELYDDLLREALEGLPEEVDELVLIPDGILHLLPFGMLRAAEDDLPLAVKYQLSAAPSATLWLRWRQNRPASVPPAALALARTRPFIPEDSVAPDDRERFWFLRDGVRPMPLEGAAREGKIVIRRTGESSVLKLDDEATEHFLKHEVDLSRFAILHFAAHALVDENYPGRSGILLAAEGEEDGLLKFRDIVELDLDGKIAVLSACSSASGAVQQGEGVLSLARAFFQAGAHTVVGSLWPLRDDEATELMDAFYEQLSAGLSVSGALQAGQLEQIRAERPAAAWAGLTVLGDGDFVPFPGGVIRVPLWRKGWFIALAAVVVLVPVGLLVHRRRTRPWAPLLDR